MENRLQFRHHTPIFETRQEAIDYIYTQIRYNTDTGLPAIDRSYGFSLLAEPTILRYKNEEDESNPHVIIAIGAATNDGTVGYGDNRFCIIDIDKTEKEIAELNGLIEDAVKGLSIVALNSNTLALHAEKTDEGTVVSGDVKLADGVIFDDFRRQNSILETENGLFMHVSMTYDQENDTIKFIVNGDALDVRLSNSKLASGVYDKKDESIHLFNNDGSEVVIDCEELIAEWGIEGENSKTPVVLTRDEIGYSSDDGHYHVEPWQDVLRADVRLKDEQKVLQDDGTYRYEKDPDSTNILSRTTDGRYLYVDGRASNIIYYDNGVKSNVRDALDKVTKNKPSSDERNIIQSKVDGLFASSTLEYVSSENTLVFKTSGQPDTRIKLNSIELFKEIYYDDTTEDLVIIYVDAEGQVQSERIPLGEMLEKWEWEPQNDGHNVWIAKTRIVNGNDKVSADARIYESDDNILVDKAHQLYVKGTADNIKYGEESNVKEALDSLIASAASTSDLTDLEAKVDAEIERSTEKDAKHDAAIAEIKATADAAINDIVNEDHSIKVDKTDPLKPVVNVNLSSEIEDARKNIIKLNNDGLYANVDLSYIKEANKLIFHTSGEESDKEIMLDGMSDILNIYYDSETEEIVIQYISNGSEHKELRFPVRVVIDEWLPSENTDGAIQLRKEKNPDNNKDILYADVIVNTTHEDNALVNDHGSLYVGAENIVQKSKLFQCLSAETESIEGVLGVMGSCDDEITYPGDRYSILSAATTFPEADLMLENAINELREAIDGIDVELIGDVTDTVETNSYLDGDGKRHIEAEVRLQGGGDDVVADDANALGVIGNEGLYLSKTWNCGEYNDSDSDDVSDESYMNYQRLS